MIFVAIFALLSLVSYDSRDPSWANSLESGHGVHNYAGRAGAHFAEALLQFLGLMAFFVPFALGFVGIKTILPDGTGRAPRPDGRDPDPVPHPLPPSLPPARELPVGEGRDPGGRHPGRPRLLRPRRLPQPRRLAHPAPRRPRPLPPLLHPLVAGPDGPALPEGVRFRVPGRHDQGHPLSGRPRKRKS